MVITTEKLNKIVSHYGKLSKQKWSPDIILEDVARIDVQYVGKDEKLVSHIKSIEGDKQFLIGDEFYFNTATNRNRYLATAPFGIVASRIAKDNGVQIDFRTEDKYCHHGNVFLFYSSKPEICSLTKESENFKIIENQLKGVIKSQNRLNEIVIKEADRLYNL